MVTNDDIKECLAFDVERNVLDDDGGGYDLVISIWILTRCGGHSDMTQRGRTARRREIGVVIGRKRTIVGEYHRVIEPLLRSQC